jgi:hypothetical protein
MNLNIHDDSAENSIMQTITIAVSAILIAAGLVTAPGLINNARDGNSRGDLANVAFVQSAMVTIKGSYWVYDSYDYDGTDYKLLADSGVEGAINFTPSDAPRLIVDITENGDGWVAVSESASGKVFVRTSNSTDTTTVTNATFSSLAAPLAGTDNSSDIDLPAGIRLNVVKNMYTAAVNDAPYDFREGLPGEGSNTELPPTTPGTTPSAPTTPTNPEPSTPAVPTTEFRSTVSKQISRTYSGNGHPMLDFTSINESQDSIWKMNGLGNAEGKNISQSADKVTQWRIANPDYNDSVELSNPNITVSLLGTDGRWIKANYVNNVSYTKSVSANNGFTVETINIAGAVFKTLTDEQIEDYVGTRQYLVEADGYKYYFDATGATNG